MNIKIQIAYIIFLLLFFTASNEPLFADDSGDLSAASVRAGIDSGISFLAEKQRNDGGWNEFPGYEPGTTALVALALLNAGVDKNTPVLAKAVNFLRKPMPETSKQTYPLSLQTMVLCLADPVTERATIEANIQWLIERQFKTSNVFRGGWSYVGAKQEFDSADNSNSQFAILALYEAERIGVAIPDSVWNDAQEYWLRLQNKDGSWGYRAWPHLPAQKTNSGSGTGSMTCAGIASLIICSGVRSHGGSSIKGDEILCCQEVDNQVAERIDLGLNWLEKHFSIQTNPGTAVDVDTWLYYYLYCLERVGRLTAHRFIGNNDWYREGAGFLLRRKGPFTKYWKAHKDLKFNNTVSTAFALLFLSKGRRPVLISKYKYGPESTWNAHPNDLLHLTRQTEKSWKIDLIWQVVDSQKATVDDLLQTPVLYICGNESIIPKDNEQRRRQAQVLRGYLEQGGFIVAEALDNDRGFEQSFREFVLEFIPEDEGQFRLLEADHPIWLAEKSIPSDQLRPIYGIDFGCRTSIVLIPSVKPTPGNSINDVLPSLSCTWESMPEKESQRLNISESAQKKIDAGVNIGINILAYATNRELKAKDEIPQSVLSELKKKENRYGTLYTAILEFGGGSSCAPRAIPNLMKTLKSELGIQVQTNVKRVTASSELLYETPIVFMHGRNTFHFNELERKNLATWFKRGGFLFANAICASEAFKQAFIEEMRKIVPDAELTPLPANDPLYSNIYGGFQLKEVSIRKRERTEGRKTQINSIKTAPELLGIKKDGRWIVLFSPHDISCALEKTGAPECAGYDRQSALKVAVNVFLYAIEHL